MVQLVVVIVGGGTATARPIVRDPIVLVAGRPAGSKPQGHQDHYEDDDHDEAEYDDVSHCTTQCLV
jgi:hypothetical protein